MDISKIEKYSVKYAILHKYIKFAHDKIFYKEVIYRGLENIPLDKPVLFAPNHQNALMDAFAIIFAGNPQTVFLARSDIFANPTIAKLLIFFKILPVYRIRDGKEKLQFNEEIFLKVADILKQNKRVTIFPEAQHIDKRHLRQVKKGIQRVSFMFGEQTEYKEDVMIVPTGIYYSNYWNFRSILQVRYGKPISAAKYFELSKLNLQKAINALGEEMQEKIQDQIIHISDLETYDILEAAREIFDVPMMERLKCTDFEQDNKFIADKNTILITEKFAKESPEEFVEFSKEITEYTSFLKRENLKDHVFEKQYSGLETILRVLLIIAGFPLFIAGALNSIIPYNLPKLITNKLQDRQFVSSINFGVSLFAFPIFFALQTIPICLFTDTWYYPIVYFVASPFLAMFSFGFSRMFVKFRSQIKFKSKAKTPEYSSMQNLRKKIVGKLNEIADKYL